MIHVQIVQPQVPLYRVPLFEGLARHRELSIHILASDEVPSRENVFTVEDAPFLDATHRCRSYLGNRVFWQQGMYLSDELGPSDVLVVNGNLRWFSNYPLLWKARSRNIGIVWWGHGHTRTGSRIADMLRWRIMRWVDAILLYTDEEVQDYVARGFPAEKLFATNNAIDIKPIEQAKSSYDEERLEAFKRVQGLDSPFFLYCGRLKPASRLDLAIKALARLNQRNLDCDLVVIGEGAVRHELEALAEQISVGDHVRWLGAIHDQEELAPWFMTATGFVYPGDIGLSLIHAMAYGLSVITHHNRRHHKPEIAALVDGGNGLMYQEGDADDLARIMQKLLLDSDLRSGLSLRSYKTITNGYTMGKMIEGFVSAVEYASHRASQRSRIR